MTLGALAALREDGLALSLTRILDRFVEICRRHHQSNDNNLLRIAIQTRGRLNSISSTRQNAVRNDVIGKPIHKDLLDREWFYERFVSHAGPQSNFFSFYSGTDARSEIESSQVDFRSLRTTPVFPQGTLTPQIVSNRSAS